MSQQNKFSELADSKITVLVRIEEWYEWLPSEVHQIGVVTDESGKTHSQNVPLSKGYSAFSLGENEKLIDLHIEANQRHMMVDDKLFSLCLFQAKIVRDNHNPVENRHVIELISEQRKPLTDQEEKQKSKGRDRRADLVIVERNAQPPTNRAGRRKRK